MLLEDLGRRVGQETGLFLNKHLWQSRGGGGGEIGRLLKKHSIVKLAKLE